MPPLSSSHGVCAAPAGHGRRLRLELLLEGLGRVTRRASDGDMSQSALGDTPEHRSNGLWSDGTPIAPLTIQDAAPIGP